MGGLGLALVVGLVAILIGAGFGYALAAARYAASAFASHQAQQALQRQLESRSDAVVDTTATTVEAAQPVASHPPAVARPKALTRAPWEPMIGDVDAAALTMVAHSASETTGNSATIAATESPKSSSQPAALSSLPIKDPPGVTLASFVAVANQAGALVMLEVDHLGKFRERYGAQLADYVSSHVERVIREVLQDTEAVITRYDSQEFLIALPDLPVANAEKLLAMRRTASKLREEIQSAFLQVGNERLTVTASLGLAMMEPGVATENLIARADEALHAAKKAGRNRAYFQHAGDCRSVDSQAESENTVTLTKPFEKGFDLNSPGKRVACRDRRRHVRQPCFSVNLIAPCCDGVVPPMELFQRVQFLDLSESGFSMIMPSMPPADRYCVALFNQRGMIFMSVEVINVRQAPRAGHIKPLIIVGCRFVQRLYPKNPLPDFHAGTPSHGPAVAAILQSL